jgi:hypothetical protein
LHTGSMTLAGGIPPGAHASCQSISPWRSAAATAAALSATPSLR